MRFPPLQLLCKFSFCLLHQSVVLSDAGLPPPSICLKWQNCLSAVPTTHNQNRRNKLSTAKKGKKSSSSNKQKRKWEALVAGIKPSMSEMLQRGGKQFERSQFRCSFIEMTRFWHFYWNLLKWFQQTALKVQFSPFYLNGVTFWNQPAQNHLPEILKYFPPKRLKYRRRKNLEHYLKTTKSETNMIQCLKNKNTKKNFETNPEK